MSPYDPRLRVILEPDDDYQATVALGVSSDGAGIAGVVEGIESGPLDLVH